MFLISHLFKWHLAEKCSGEVLQLVWITDISSCSLSWRASPRISKLVFEYLIHICVNLKITSPGHISPLPTILNERLWWHHLIINMYMMSSRHICVLSIFGTLHLCFSPTLYCIHHSQISKKVIIYICSVVGQRNKYEMIDTVIKLPTVNLKKLKRNDSLDY